MEPCKHGVPRDWCGICTTPLPTVHVPTVRAGEAQRTRQLTTPATSAGYVVVGSKGGRRNYSIQQLSPETTYVHIVGVPMLWLVKTIVERAPNLKTLRVNPTCLRKLKARHRELLEQRGIEVVTGHHRPESAWEPDRGQISPFYPIQRTFLLELQGEQLVRFQELCAFAFDSALMTARYFCLKGEAYVPQRVIAEEFGFDSAYEQYVSRLINAVLFYLGFSDPSFNPGKESKRHANTLENRVKYLRPLGRSAALRQAWAERHGFQELATNLPLARLETYRTVLTAQREGRLETLRAKSEQAWRAITLRFGLDQQGVSVYRTLQEVAGSMALSKQRVFQLEAYALEYLGISEE